MEEGQLRSLSRTIVLMGWSLVVGVLTWVGVLIAYQGGNSEAARSWLFAFGLVIFLDASDLVPVRTAKRGLKVLMFILEGAVLAGMLWLVWMPPQLLVNWEFSLPWVLLGLLSGTVIIGVIRQFHKIMSARKEGPDSPYIGKPGTHGYFGLRDDT